MMLMAFATVDEPSSVGSCFVSVVVDVKFYYGLLNIHLFIH